MYDEKEIIPDTSLEKRQESSSGDSNVHLDTHARKKNHYITK
jgi:hypothetical protein